MGKINKVMLTLAASVALCLPAIAQNKVHAKMVKVIDGDSTVIERDIDESELPAMEKELGDTKGKNVKVMMFVEKENASEKIPMRDHFFMRDSLPGGCKMVRKEIINGRDTMVFLIPDMKDGFSRIDTAMGRSGFMFGFPPAHDDLLMLQEKNENSFELMIPNEKEIEQMINGFSFDYNIENEDGKERMIIRSMGPDSTGKVVIKKFEGKPGDEFRDDVIINSPNGKTVRKISVTTRVRIEDGKSGSKASKKEKSNLKPDDLKFYPNPSDGKFSIEFESDGKQPVSIVITDMNGKQVQKQEVSGEGKHSLSFDLRSEGKGTYILNLQQGKKSTTKKIIIE
jgi:hypothetical protein